MSQKFPCSRNKSWEQQKKKKTTLFLCIHDSNKSIKSSSQKRALTDYEDKTVEFYIL